MTVEVIPAFVQGPWEGRAELCSQYSSSRNI